MIIKIMKKLLALVLAAVMAFAAVCAFAEGKVVLKMGDREVTAEEAQKRISEQLQYVANLYASYGYAYDVNDPAHIAEVREAVLKAYPQLGEWLKPVFESLDEKTLQQLNASIAVEGLDAKKVAADYLKSKGLVK